MPLDDMLCKYYRVHITHLLSQLSEREGLKVKEKWEADLDYNYDGKDWAVVCEKKQLKNSNKTTGHIIMTTSTMSTLFVTGNINISPRKPLKLWKKIPFVIHI